MFKKIVTGVLLGAAATASFAATLDEVVTEGLSKNPSVRQAISARNAVYQEVRQAEGNYYPSVNISAGAGYEWTKNPSTRALPGDGDTEMMRGELGLSIRQMIFDGFATMYEVNRQKARALSADKRLVDTAEKYALSAARSYIELNRRNTLLQQAKETLYNHVKVYEQIKRRSESGLGALASIQQAEGRLALAEVNVLAAENNLLDAQANFRKITGLDVPDELAYPEVTKNISVPDNLTDATKIALQNHPTLKVAEADTMAAVAQYNASKQNFYPHFAFEVDGNLNNNIDGVDGSNNDLTAMFRMRYNLYNGGSDKAKIRQTQYQIQEAKAIQSDTHRQVIQSLGLSWNAYSILTRQLQYLETHVASSQSTRNSYQKQFNIGQRSLLDLLDTENEVFSAKTDLTNALHDRLIAQYRILNGMGLLLDALNLSMPEPNLGDVVEESDVAAVESE